MSPFARAPPDGVEVTFVSLKRKLSETLSSMREVHSSHLMYKARLESDIAELEESLPRLRIEEAATSQRYSFYAETKAYICNLLVCLDAKVGEGGANADAAGRRKEDCGARCTFHRRLDRVGVGPPHRAW